MLNLKRAGLAAGLLMLAGTGEAWALANPASVFCVQQGGRVVIVRDRAGNERGICVLRNGRRVDEWDYFRRHHRQK